MVDRLLIDHLFEGVGMKWVAGLFFTLSLAVGAPVLADPPMKVVYSTSATTHFNWKWPYHPVEKYTAVQTKPYYYTGQILNFSQEDVSKYRFYFRQRTCRNEWGYFFPPGTKLCSKRPPIVFGDPQAYREVIYQK
jgi:hypothetical protein